MPIKNRMNASVAPTATDDASQGYAIGSEWFDKITAGIYRCLDATAGAAVWAETNPDNRYWPVGGELGPEWAFGLAADGAATPNRLLLMPWTFRRRCQIDKISIKLTTSGSAGAAMRCALYRDNPAVFNGAVLLRETAPFALDVSAAGTPRIGPDDLAWDVHPGNYLVGFLFNSVTTMPQLSRINSTNRGGQVARPEGGDLSGASVFLRSFDMAYGPMPTTVVAPPLVGDVAPYFQLLRGA